MALESQSKRDLTLTFRPPGMDKLHTSMNTYIKSMSQRKEGDDREKMLPVDVLAQAMIAHGEEFESDSLFGTCLISTKPLRNADVRTDSNVNK